MAKEQIRDRFLGKECYKILRMKQQAFENKPKSDLGKATLKIEIIQNSLLAMHFKEVYESFAYRETKKIKINNWIQLTI